MPGPLLPSPSLFPSASLFPSGGGALDVTYLGDLARVRLTITGAPSAADYAVIERSTNQVTWTTVRGGDQVPLTGGSGWLDDYEFTAGVTNYYRVSYVDNAPISFVAAGTSVTANNGAALTPPLPAGVAVGDLLLALVSIRNSGAGTVNTPDGWEKLVDAGNFALLGRRYEAGAVAPIISFSGAVANADTLGQIAAWRNAELVPTTFQTLLNASAQNIAYPALNVPGPHQLVVIAGWKQDDWTSVSSPTAEVAEIVSTAGDDAGMVWCYLIETSEIDVVPFTFGVTGGAAAISRGMTVAFEPATYVDQDVAWLTPTIDKVWIKNLARPYLNVALSNPVGLLSIGRKARAGLYDVIGRSNPIAVTDVRAAKTYTVGALVESDAERELLDTIITPGDVVLFQYPPGVRLKSAYVAIGDTTFDDEAATYNFPLTEVAAPASTVVGATITWADVIATYVAWSDLMTAKATWADVLASVGDPTNIITG